MTDIIKILLNGGHSCVIRNGAATRSFDRRGVADLYALLTTDPGFLKGAEIADKVVGKAAAALMVLGGVGRVWAGTISEGALGLLRGAGIPVEGAHTVPYIKNRDGSGMCPMERLCLDEPSPEAILPRIENFLSSLTEKHDRI